MKRILASVALPLLAGCAATYAPKPTPEPSGPGGTLAFVEANCSGCHAIGKSGESPNVHAPAFHQIANSGQFTQETLSKFLADGHGYPDQMDVEVDTDKTNAVAAYIMSLRAKD